MCMSLFWCGEVWKIKCKDCTPCNTICYYNNTFRVICLNFMVNSITWNLLLKFIIFVLFFIIIIIFYFILMAFFNAKIQSNLIPRVHFSVIEINDNWWFRSLWRFPVQLRKTRVTKLIIVKCQQRRLLTR